MKRMSKENFYKTNRLYEMTEDEIKKDYEIYLTMLEYQCEKNKIKNELSRKRKNPF